MTPDPKELSSPNSRRHLRSPDFPFVGLWFPQRRLWSCLKFESEIYLPSGEREVGGDQSQAKTGAELKKIGERRQLNHTTNLLPDGMGFAASLR